MKIFTFIDDLDELLIKSLKEDDLVDVFYVNETDSIPLSLLNIIQNSNIQKNTLSYHFMKEPIIPEELGYLIGLNGYKVYSKNEVLQPLLNRYPDLCINLKNTNKKTANTNNPTKQRKKIDKKTFIENANINNNNEQEEQYVEEERKPILEEPMPFIKDDEPKRKRKKKIEDIPPQDTSTVNIIMNGVLVSGDTNDNIDDKNENDRFDELYDEFSQLLVGACGESIRLKLGMILNAINNKEVKSFEEGLFIENFSNEEVGNLLEALRYKGIEDKIVALGKEIWKYNS